jgi:hypothetical protein
MRRNHQPTRQDPSRPPLRSVHLKRCGAARFDEQNDRDGRRPADTGAGTAPSGRTDLDAATNGQRSRHDAPQRKDHQERLLQNADPEGRKQSASTPLLDKTTDNDPFGSPGAVV